MKISISGYKSISSPISIETNGLTILSGANSSGKSSFMQPFLLIKQTLESNFDTGAILLDGANAKLTDSSEALSKTSHSRRNKLSISIEKGEHFSSITFKRSTNYGLIIDSAEVRDNDTPKGLTLRIGMQHDQIKEQLPKQRNTLLTQISKSFGASEWCVIRRKCFLFVELKHKTGKFSPLKVGISPSALIEDFVKKLIHVPGLRGNPERSYRVADCGDIFPGSFEPYVASIINNWKNNQKTKDRIQTLTENLQTLGLAKHIKTTRINDTRIEVKVSRHKGADDGDCVNIADVGFGVTQTLPVLVALLSAKPGQFVYIEQPELHLHPRAQYKLAEIIGSAVDKDVRVILETHSSILIRGIQVLVAKKKISKDKISLNWFSQEPRSGRSVVTKSQLDDTGAFGDWPADFDEVSLAADIDYLNAVEDALYVKK